MTRTHRWTPCFFRVVPPLTAVVLRPAAPVAVPWAVAPTASAQGIGLALKPRPARGGWSYPRSGSSPLSGSRPRENPRTSAVEAQAAAANTFAGGMSPADCAGCSDGHRAGTVEGEGGTLAFNGVQVRPTGAHQMAVASCPGAHAADVDRIDVGV